MAESQNVQYTKMCSPQKTEIPLFFYVGLSLSYSYEFLRFKRLMDKFQLKLSLFAQAGNRSSGSTMGSWQTAYQRAIGKNKEKKKKNK